MQIVDFGRTGLKVSRLGIGTGSNGWNGHSDQTSLGLDGLPRLLRQAFDHGLNLWDAADEYGSHQHVARALKGLPRQDVVIVTKTMARKPDRITQDVDRFLKELETDCLDVVLMHCLSPKDWTKKYAPAMQALSRAKEQGKLRAVGVSCHGFGALQAAAASDWPEVVMVRLNPLGVNMDDSPAKVLPVIERMYRDGKAVYGMKVYGAGQLTGQRSAMLAYALGQKFVHAFTIGMTSEAQLLENLQLYQKLTA
jgi:aryl-alcohol dehydrogenase-like predicted oxidoreductase